MFTAALPASMWSILAVVTSFTVIKQLREEQYQNAQMHVCHKIIPSNIFIHFSKATEKCDRANTQYSVLPQSTTNSY